MITRSGSRQETEPSTVLAKAKVVVKPNLKFRRPPGTKSRSTKQPQLAVPSNTTSSVDSEGATPQSLGAAMRHLKQRKNRSKAAAERVIALRTQVKRMKVADKPVFHSVQRKQVKPASDDSSTDSEQEHANDASSGEGTTEHEATKRKACNQLAARAAPENRSLDYDSQQESTRMNSLCSRMKIWLLFLFESCHRLSSN